MNHCRVYWGSHGCHKERGHDGPHECGCCDCPDHAANQGLREDEEGEWRCVGKPPYYGPGTRFYGEDVGPHELKVVQPGPKGDG